MVVSIVLLGFQELLGLGEQTSGKTDRDGEASCDPEDSLPCLCCTTDTKIGAGSEHISERVSLLQDTRHQTSCIDWTMLKCHGDGVTVDTSHEETEERSDGQELLKCLGVDGGNLEEAHFRHH